MNWLKISVFACLFLFSLTLSAQKGRLQQMVNVDSLKAELQLTAQQETDIRNIVENYKPKIKEVRESNTDQTARREAVAPILQAMQGEIKAVLTEEQKLKLEAMKANRPKRKKP